MNLYRDILVIVLLECFTIISIGVFGSGKSYLLSVIVIFLAELLFPLLEESSPSSSLQHSSYTPPLKLLISSSTNVAVDRVLMGYDL